MSFQFPLLGIFLRILVMMVLMIGTLNLSIPITWDFPPHHSVIYVASRSVFHIFQFPLLGIFLRIFGDAGRLWTWICTENFQFPLLGIFLRIRAVFGLILQLEAVSYMILDV